MPIWKLTPIDTDSDLWRQSDYKNTVIVRADNKQHARSIASPIFTVAVKRRPNTKTLHDPWQDEQLVACERIDDPEYKEQGTPEILFPKV